MAALDKPHLVLASTSPRRREILTVLGFRFEVCKPLATELTGGGLNASELALENARLKARDVRSRDNRTRIGDRVRKLFLGVDTIVVRDGIVLSKPIDTLDAKRMLTSLSERKHEVLSGLCLVSSDGREAHRVVSTDVHFAKLCPAEVDWYVETGEPADKAGAYGIQGLASLFVRRIQGCYYNVVGLPVRALYEVLAELGVPPLELIGPAGGNPR